jgi:hypothetical protein
MCENKFKKRRPITEQERKDWLAEIGIFALLEADLDAVIRLADSGGLDEDYADIVAGDKWDDKDRLICRIEIRQFGHECQDVPILLWLEDGTDCEGDRHTRLGWKIPNEQKVGRYTIRKQKGYYDAWFDFDADVLCGGDYNDLPEILQVFKARGSGLR